MSEMLPLLAGGLVLFLYAISQLSRSMQSVFSDEAKRIIGKYTTNLFSAILIGTVVTILLGSSSAAIIITLIFINAKTLSFKQAIGIIMGANIGTTFSSQLIALDISQYAWVPLVIGLAVDLFAKRESWKQNGRILFFFGLLFFGLSLMEQSVAPLRDSPTFETWIAKLESPVQGALIGGLVTLIIQSSSATVGMAILLGKQNLITVAGGIAVMLGAELGTCSDTLLATINGSRQTLKAGLFHFLFNLLTIMLGLIFFYPFVQLVDWISGHQPIDNQIAHAHMLFNISGVLLFVPVAHYMGRALDYVLPDKSNPTAPSKS